VGRGGNRDAGPRADGRIYRTTAALEAAVEVFHPGQPSASHSPCIGTILGLHGGAPRLVGEGQDGHDLDHC